MAISHFLAACTGRETRLQSDQDSGLDGWGLGALNGTTARLCGYFPQTLVHTGPLEQWQLWRQELLRLGQHAPGVDVELNVADAMIAELQSSGGFSVPGNDLHARELRRIQSEQIGVSPITGPEALQRRVGDLLLDVDMMLRAAQDKRDPEWWRFADLRDDLVDVLNAMVGVRPDASE